jgi:hypothetical protein
MPWWNIAAAATSTPCTPKHLWHGQSLHSCLWGREPSSCSQLLCRIRLLLIARASK